ncbi:MAG: hypothetical protein R2911_32555 [Caldilineaceae bacterium]
MDKFAPLNMTPAEIIDYTPEWTGERFADGRPHVPDALIARQNVTITEAWGILRGDGYHHQYEDGWFCTHPGQVLAGRADSYVHAAAPANARHHGGEGGGAGLCGRPDFVAHRHAGAGRCLRGRCLWQDRAGAGDWRQPGHIDLRQVRQRGGA